MLRLEQGFSESLFDAADNDNLRGYTNHHRLVMPALIAHDLMHAARSETAAEIRLEAVINGRLRDTTLAFEADNIKHFNENLGWRAVKNFFDINTTNDVASDNWRIAKRDDEHVAFPGYRVWAATRNLRKLPENVEDERATRVRERYTFTASEQLAEDDIRKVLLDNEAPDDVMLATATVYAINKQVPKASLSSDAFNINDFPHMQREMRLRLSR